MPKLGRHFSVIGGQLDPENRDLEGVRLREEKSSLDRTEQSHEIEAAARGEHSPPFFFC